MGPPGRAPGQKDPRPHALRSVGRTGQPHSNSPISHSIPPHTPRPLDTPILLPPPVAHGQGRDVAIPLRHRQPARRRRLPGQVPAWGGGVPVPSTWGNHKNMRGRGVEWREYAYFNPATVLPTLAACSVSRPRARSSVITSCMVGGGQRGGGGCGGYGRQSCKSAGERRDRVKERMREIVGVRVRRAALQCYIACPEPLERAGKFRRGWRCSCGH